MKPVSIGDFVEVEWLDAHADAKAEVTMEDINAMKSYRFKTYGILVRDDRHITGTSDPLVAIAAEVGEDGRYRGVTFIPQGMVVGVLRPKMKRAKRAVTGVPEVMSPAPANADLAWDPIK